VEIPVHFVGFLEVVVMYTKLSIHLLLVIVSIICTPSVTSADLIINNVLLRTIPAGKNPIPLPPVENDLPTGLSFNFGLFNTFNCAILVTGVEDLEILLHGEIGAEEHSVTVTSFDELLPFKNGSKNIPAQSVAAAVLEVDVHSSKWSTAVIALLALFQGPPLPSIPPPFAAIRARGKVIWEDCPNDAVNCGPGEKPFTAPEPSALVLGLVGFSFAVWRRRSHGLR
jgi:hypothetical protein